MTALSDIVQLENEPVESVRQLKMQLMGSSCSGYLRGFQRGGAARTFFRSLAVREALSGTGCFHERGAQRDRNTSPWTLLELLAFSLGLSSGMGGKLFLPCLWTALIPRFSEPRVIVD